LFQPWDQVNTININAESVGKGCVTIRQRFQRCSVACDCLPRVGTTRGLKFVNAFGVSKLNQYAIQTEPARKRPKACKRPDVHLCSGSSTAPDEPLL
jgi:hypothetical protein